MDVKQIINTLEMKAWLSNLWIFALLNVIFRDIHELFRPGLLEEMMTGTVNGVQMTQEILLVAGIFFEIPIVMVLLSRILPRRINRWANVVAGAVTLVFLISNGPNDLDDVWFLGITAVALLIIIGSALRWTNRSYEMRPSVLQNRAEAEYR